MFQKVLVANRGEIALRIVRALRDLGVQSVAVYSDVDRLSPHVRYADEAHCIGPAPATESYLDGDKIIATAKAAGADAIHPGYGFLAENTDFVEACHKADLAFIGPEPDAMRLLGDKLSARAVARKANVPLVPGTGEIANVAEAVAAVRRIGLPAMIKAARGGGGRGIRRIETEDEIEDAIARAMREAEISFGDPCIYMERAMKGVRHIEVQIIADQFGNIVPVGVRECSIQRRHQKIIEECPSPAVDDDLRRRLIRAAVRITRTAGYTSLGTVEFLLDHERNHYFLEVNTRLQVEHPVTEMVAGIDLVKDQIHVAAGEELAYEGTDLLPTGWAIECRLVAEDPFNDFLPSIGRVVLAREPAGPGIRVESALYDGMEVTPYYDSLLAKVTAHARTRDRAIRRMKRALSECRVVGVATNIPYLLHLLDLPDFIEGRMDTTFLDNHRVFVEEAVQEQRQTAEIAALLLTTGSPAPSLNGNAAGSTRRRRGPSAWRQVMGGLRGGGSGRWPKSI
ncbi:MAG: acetyl/propionyl/methylcrotonyl-CoA carboxylase subunit alpha [Dehalococcoidia bacterium]